MCINGLSKLFASYSNPQNGEKQKYDLSKILKALKFCSQIWDVPVTSQMSTEKSYIADCNHGSLWSIWNGQNVLTLLDHFFSGKSISTDKQIHTQKMTQIPRLVLPLLSL